VDFDPSTLYNRFRATDFFLTPGPAAQQLIAADPQRIFLLVQAQLQPCQLRPYKFPNANQGILVISGGTPFIADYAKYGAVVGADWYILPPMAGGNYYVLSISFVPEN